MIEDKQTSPFDYYDIDACSVGKPWLNVDGGAGVHHHLLLEVLPTIASESWLKKFIVSQYRWKLSIWSSGNERISADTLLPINTVKQYQFSSGFSTVSGSTFNPSSSTGNGDSRVGAVQSGNTRDREVLVFDLDCASIALAEILGETGRGKTLESSTKKKKVWVPGDGVHLVIELVHEVSGVPVSRGMVNLKPFEDLDPSFFKASSDVNKPPLSKAGPMTYNQCYSVAVPIATSENRTTGLETSIKRASSGADMHVPIQFNVVAAFVKGATRATQWGIRKANEMNRHLSQTTAAMGTLSPTIKMTSFPSNVPSLSDVLPSTLRYRLPSTDEKERGNEEGGENMQQRHMSASGRPMSPARLAREDMYNHLRDKARAVRVYATIADVHISEDLLELCKADRVVLTGHCVDPAQLPTSHTVFQNTSEAISAVIASANEDLAAAMAAAGVEEDNTKKSGASKVMHPTPSSHPSARPTALAEMASNNVGDYHRSCELLTPSLEGRFDPHSVSRNYVNSPGKVTVSQTEMGAERSLTSLYPTRGAYRSQRPKHHSDCVPRMVHLGMQGFSCIGDNTQLMREHIKFTHKCVELCTGQLTLEDLVVREDGKERGVHETEQHDDDHEHDFSQYEAGSPLVSGLYRVPMYTEPTRVVIGTKPSKGDPTGVLVGEIFVHIVVQRDTGLDVDRLHADPHYPGTLNTSPNPGSPSHMPSGPFRGGLAPGLGLLPPPTMQASQTPEAVAARLMDMLESPRSLTAHRILLCVSGDSVHVLKAEENRERMRAAGIPLPYDEDEDEEEEEDMHDSGETEDGGSIIASPLLPSLLHMFTRLFVPLSASAIIDMIVSVEGRLRNVGPAAAGATVGTADERTGTNSSLISPKGALFILLMMLLERLMVDERNCDTNTVELISRSIDDRGASSVLWHYFQACLRVDTVGAILSLVQDHDEVMEYVDKGHILEEEQEDAPSAPTALTWRHLRVACFSMRVLAATAWVDRNPRVGDVKDSILAGLPPPPPLKMEGHPGVGLGGSGGSKQKALIITSRQSTTGGKDRRKSRRSTIGRRASSQALNRRASSNVVSQQRGSPAPLPKTRRRRSSATHSYVHAAATMPHYASASASETEEEEEEDMEASDDDDDEGDMPYYHTTDSAYHAGGDSHTLSLCKDLTILLLSYARRLSLSLLHEYRVCEVTVSEHSETYRKQGQEDFAQQALRELDAERVETCLEIMSIVRHTIQCVSNLWTLFKPGDLDKEMVELLLSLVKVLPVTPLVREDAEDPEGLDDDDDYENDGIEEHEDEDDVRMRQQKQRRLHFLVNSVVALIGQLATTSIIRHCADLELCSKANIRRFTDTAIFGQIQSEGKYSSRTAKEPNPHFSSPMRDAQLEAELHPETRARIESEYGKGQLISSLVALYAAFTARVYAPVSARKKIDDSIDCSPTAALTLHLTASTLYSCFRRRLHLPSESAALKDNSSQGFGESLGQVTSLMPRGERRKNKGKSTKEMAPQVSRIRSASIIPGGQAMLAALPGAGASPPGSPGSPGRGSPGSPSNAFQYNIPSNTPSAGVSGWAGAFQQAHALTSFRDRGYSPPEEDGQRVLFGNEAVMFVAERHEMFKAIMTLLGTASGASTRTSTSALSRKGAPRPSSSSSYTGTPSKRPTPSSAFAPPPTHMVASGAVIRECVQHLKRVSEMSELLLSAALHAVNGHSRKLKKDKAAGMEGNASVRRALFLEKGSSEGGVGSSFVLLLMLVVTNTREYWREIRRLHLLKGDDAITSAADDDSQPSAQGTSGRSKGGLASRKPFSPVSSPIISPLVLAPESSASALPGGSFGSLYRAQSTSLHERLERDTSLLVDAASALMTRPEVDKDLSPRETRVYHRHRTRYRTLARAVAVAAGLLEGSPPPTDSASAYAEGAGHVEEEEDIGVSIVTWLTLRQRLINTIAVVTDIASSMKLFSASAIQTQAEAELYEILIGNKPSSGDDDSDNEPKLSAHKESLRGTRRNGRSGFINRMEALRKLALLHFHGQEEHGAGGTSSGAIMAGGDMIPLTRLIWLLRDLSDLSPLLDTRPDMALLALSDDRAVRNVLRALVQASLAVPVHIDEDSSVDKAGHHDAKKQNALFVHAFHHRYHQHHEDSINHKHVHQGHHAHSHISNDRTRVRNRVAIALHQARQDLISAAVTIMQILTTDAAAGAGDLGANKEGPPPPMRHETYFQSLMDALVLRCIPSKIAVSPESTIGVLLGQAHDLTPQGRRAGGRLDHHHYQYGGYNAQTSTGSAPRCAATITTIIDTLTAAHVQGTGGEGDGGGEGEESQEETVLSPDALGALLRLRNRLVMRLQAVRMYVLGRIRIMSFTPNPRITVVSEAGRVLNRKYSQLAAAAALNNLLHMSPVVESHSNTHAPQQVPVAGWALGGIERRLVLMEIAELTEYPLGDGQGLAWHQLRAEHGEGHPTGSLAVEGVPLDMVPSRWGMHSGEPPKEDDEDEEGGGGGIKGEVREKAKLWKSIAQREENEQRARHLRLVLPPCPCKSTSGGHGAAAKLLLLALFRSHMLPISAVSATAEELRANAVGPMTNDDQLGPVSNFESKQTRAVLAALLESGDWEIGLSLAGIFQRAFADKVEVLKAYLASLGGGKGSQNVRGLGFDQTGTSLPQGLPQSHNQQYMAHMRHLLARATKLAEETAHSEDLLKRNLLHEGDARLLPMYYAVRITACPWTRAPNLASPFNPSPFDKADQAKMEALLAATGMELIGVVLGGDEEDPEGIGAYAESTQGDGSVNESRSEGEAHRGLAEHSHAGNTSLRGTWLLLRFDASAQKVSGHHMRIWSSDVAHYVPPSPAEAGPQKDAPPPPPALHEVTGIGGEIESDASSVATSVMQEPTRPTEHLEPAPGAPLPPTARSVVERSLQLAFPHHMVLPSDYLAAPANPVPPPQPSSVATPHAAGLNGSNGSSYHTSAVSGAENASKVIQVFDAFPAPLIDEYYIRKKNAHLRHAQRKEDKRQAKEMNQPHPAAAYASSKRRDSLNGRFAASGSPDGGFGSSFENFDSNFSPTSQNNAATLAANNSPPTKASDPFFSPGQGTMDAWMEFDNSDEASSTEDSASEDERMYDHYDSSPISKKNKILERRRDEIGNTGRGGNVDAADHSRMSEVAAEDWAAASHADMFYLYVASDPSNIHHGQAHHHHHSHTDEVNEGGKIMTRLTLSVLSVSKGGDLSHGHHHGGGENPHSHTHHQSQRRGQGDQRDAEGQERWFPNEHEDDDHTNNGKSVHRHTRWAGHLEHAIKAMHFVSPCALLYPVETKHLTAFTAGLEIMWYQAKQVKRLSAAARRASELTSGEIQAQSQNDLTCLDAVLSGVSTQVMNMVMQPLRNPCSLANSRSIIAGELERLDSAMQKERKFMKRRFIQSKSFSGKYKAGGRSSDFFEEQPLEPPNFAALDRKYRHRKYNVNKMVKLRETCFEDLKTTVATFRKCTEKIHHAYGNLGKNGGKPSSLVELNEAMGEVKDDLDMTRVNTITLMDMEVERDDAAQLTDTWTQITLLIESNLASVEIGTTV